MESVGQVVGYVRVSSADQNPGRQYEALGDVARVFEDRISGKSTAHRVGLAEMLDYVRAGDTLRVASLDRLARNLADLLDLVSRLTAKGVRVEFVKESLTFTGNDDDAMSHLLLGVLGSIAAFERSLIRERQREGIALAKRAGRYKGRRPSLTPAQVEDARRLLAEGVAHAKVARGLGVSRQTLYDALAGRGTYAQQAA